LLKGLMYTKVGEPGLEVFSKDTKMWVAGHPEMAARIARQHIADVLAHEFPKQSATGIFDDVLFRRRVLRQLQDRLDVSPSALCAPEGNLHFKDGITLKLQLDYNDQVQTGAASDRNDLYTSRAFVELELPAVKHVIEKFCAKQPVLPGAVAAAVGESKLMAHLMKWLGVNPTLEILQIIATTFAGKKYPWIFVLPKSAYALLSGVLLDAFGDHRRRGYIFACTGGVLGAKKVDERLRKHAFRAKIGILSELPPRQSMVPCVALSWMQSATTTFWCTDSGAVALEAPDVMKKLAVVHCESPPNCDAETGLPIGFSVSDLMNHDVELVQIVRYFSHTAWSMSDDNAAYTARFVAAARSGTQDVDLVPVWRLRKWLVPRIPGTRPISAAKIADALRLAGDSDPAGHMKKHGFEVKVNQVRGYFLEGVAHTLRIQDIAAEATGASRSASA
jgi:hypothetical protein